MGNKVSPSPKQKTAFEYLKTARDLGEAMRKAGYSEITSTHPKQNLVDTAGFKMLVNQYREELKTAGVNTEIMAKIQAAGLFDKDPKIRLEYLKETKRDFGLSQADLKVSNTLIGISLDKKRYEW